MTAIPIHPAFGVTVHPLNCGCPGCWWYHKADREERWEHYSGVYHHPSRPVSEREWLSRGRIVFALPDEVLPEDAGRL